MYSIAIHLNESIRASNACDVAMHRMSSLASRVQYKLWTTKFLDYVHQREKLIAQVEFKTIFKYSCKCALVLHFKTMDYFHLRKGRTPWPKIKPWSFIVVLWNTRWGVNQETRVRFRGLAWWCLYFFRWFRFRMWLFCSLAGALDRCSTGYFLSVSINFFYRIFFTAVPILCGWTCFYVFLVFVLYYICSSVSSTLFTAHSSCWNVILFHANYHFIWI